MVFHNQTENIVMNVVLIVTTVTDNEGLGKHHGLVVVNLRMTMNTESYSNHSSAANENTSVTGGLDVRGLDVMSKRGSNALNHDSSRKKPTVIFPIMLAVPRNSFPSKVNMEQSLYRLPSSVQNIRKVPEDCFCLDRNTDRSTE